MEEKILLLVLERIALKETYTIGKLFIDGKYECDTLEDKVRDLNKNGKFDNGEVKVFGETAIPYGTYIIDMNTISPKFSKYKQYEFCKGRLPRLIGVNGFEGVLIHIGNKIEDTYGCILVGKNKIKGQLVDSTITFKALYEKLDKAHNDGFVIKLIIK